MALRGRPAERMTPYRQRVVEEVTRRSANGQRVIVAAVARKLGVDRRSARRIIADVRRLEMVAN